MTIFRYIASENYLATVGANETINLAEYEIDGVNPGQSGGGAGIIPPRPADSSERGLQLIISNRQGTDVAYLASNEEIAAHDPADDSAVPFGALIVQAGQSDTFGPFEWGSFNLLLRQSIGAQCSVSVVYSGARIPS